MSYIVKKMIKGYPYLYQVRTERTGGKVKQIFEKYLGRAENVDIDILKKLVAESKPKNLKALPVKIRLKGIRRKRKSIPIDTNWQIIRSLIYGRDNGICWICRQFVSLHEYDLGHLVDKHNGGQDDYNNLAVMHKRCNLLKPSHYTLDEHITWLLKTRVLEDKTITNFGFSEPIHK